MYGDIDDFIIRVQKRLRGIGDFALLDIAGQGLPGIFAEYITNMGQRKSGLAGQFLQMDFFLYTSLHKGTD